jgi:hypothetical protein
MGPAYFNEEGKKLRLFLLEVKVYIACNIENAAPSDADIFIRNFPCWYKLYGDKFRDSLLFDLLQVAMKRIAGISNSPVGPKVMNFNYMKGAKSPQTARMVSASLYGPAFRNIRKGTNILDANLGKPIIARDIEEAAEVFVSHHKRHFEKSD